MGPEHFSLAEKVMSNPNKIKRNGSKKSLNYVKIIINYL